MRHCHQYDLASRAAKHVNSFRLYLGFGVILAFGLWASSDAWAVNVSPTAVTFYAIEGAADPSSQAISVSKGNNRQTKLTATDNAAWLAVSPSSAIITSATQVSMAAKVSGLRAGTYTATVTIKLDKGGSTVVPVTLSVLPATTLSTTSTTTSTTEPTTSTTSSTTSSTTDSTTSSITTTTTFVSSTKSVSVAWDPVTSTGLAGYKVYVGTAPGTYGTPIDVGNVTSSSVNSLLIGTTYYFFVTAYNTDGLESLPSTEVSRTIN